MSFIALRVSSLGFGIEINKLFNIGKSKLFITVILPKGVKFLRFHTVIIDLILCFFFCIVNSLEFVKIYVKSYP